MTARISFFGGAQTVTGSRFVFESESSKTLVDAGLFQGLKELRRRNWAHPGFDITAIDRLLLTHAHIDHSGYIPRLVKMGFRAPIHCTPATWDLVRLLLLDAAKIQEEDAAYANKKGYSKHQPALPLFTTEDAEASFELMQPVEYDRWLKLSSHVRARFVNAGHILGSASIEIEQTTGKEQKRIVFSGDVGRYDVPLHSDPDPLTPCDYLVVESTYGDRSHEHKSIEQQIAAPMREALEQQGTVLIPSFAVGRVQLVTLILRRLMNEKKIPDLPIHIDSPMAVDATRIYSKHLRDESLDGATDEGGSKRLFPKNVHFHRSTEQSMELNDLSGPRIIISSSGMLTGGRVLHHLRRVVTDPKNLLLLVGYQAKGTRGRRMLEGQPDVRVHGEDIPVHCKLLQVGGLSAHADQQELLRWMTTNAVRPKKVFVTHGEPESAEAFARLVTATLKTQAIVPTLGQVEDLW